MKTPLSVVLFDVGGVLVQLTGVETILGWTANRYSPDELWHLWLHSPAVRAFESGRMDAPTFAIEMIRELDVPLAPEQFLQSFTAWPTGLFPGVPELIARIPMTYTRALLSNSNDLHWPRVLGEMGLGALFEHRFVSHLTGKIKPDRDAFEHVTESLGCRPQQVLFLDDNLLNVEAARSLGMQGAVVRGINQVERALLAAACLAEPSV
jgi:glucose-1-phosphatase